MIFDIKDKIESSQSAAAVDSVPFLEKKDYAGVKKW
jgi:hypothetical protein